LLEISDLPAEKWVFVAIEHDFGKQNVRAVINGDDVFD
jgi:hypothetical protein